MLRQPILVVDDHPINLKLACVLLKVDGYAVHTAACAADVLEYLKTSHPPMILMDIQLPDIDGLTLTRRIKADPATQDIKIIAVTAYAMKGDGEKAMAAGCDGYIAKPIDAKALSGLMARLLAE